MLNVKRLLLSFKYALKGLFRVFKEEQNLRIQTLIAIIVVSLSIIFSISRFEWLIIILLIGLVILMEIVNSAVERVADMLKPRLNTYVKEIKDIMAAAVFFASLLAFIAGFVIFWPKMF